jgi:hypothetical protein
MNHRNEIEAVLISTVPTTPTMKSTLLVAPRAVSEPASPKHTAQAKTSNAAISKSATLLHQARRPQ